MALCGAGQRPRHRLGGAQRGRGAQPRAELSARHGDPALRFCDAYANASHEAGHGGNPNSWTDNGYSSLATVGPKTGMTCYIREEIQGLPLFLQPPKACVGQGPMFCMRFHVG